MRKSVVTVEQLANLERQHRTPHLRLYVKGGGCNGLQYGIEPVSIEDAPSTQLDTTVAVEGNLSVHVCQKSLLFLIGTPNISVGVARPFPCRWPRRLSASVVKKSA
jgi:Fe-S cluster assembly iron-binding protein IscA